MKFTNCRKTLAMGCAVLLASTLWACQQTKSATPAKSTTSAHHAVHTKGSGY